MALFSTVVLILLAGLGNTAPSHGGSETSGPPTATVANGTYQGYYQPTYNQDYFLGVPFAQPPVGDLRFRIPEPLNSTFSGVKAATALYPECVGYGGDDLGYEVSEDCLALNIIRPSGYEGQSLPVGVWIHGGGYVMGGTSDQRYNLSAIVQNGVECGKPFIGVAIAYRLSAWGFLDGNEIRSEGNTNLGIRDQRLALQWLQENVAAFGGDPSKVTIWGESAGAGSVGIHAIAYGGRDDSLFSGIIGESGSPLLLGSSNYNVSQGQAIFANITSTTGCSSLACLRALPFSTLNAAVNITPSYTFDPYVDGDVIRGSVYSQLLAGQFVKVPYLIGTNSDEGTAFGPKGIDNDTAFYQYLLSPAVGADPASAAILEATYPDIPAVGIPETVNYTLGAPYGYQYKRASAFGGDFTFIAGRRLVTQQWARYNATSYGYRFNTIPFGLNDIIGVTHFQEVAFVFNNINGLGFGPVWGTVNPFETKLPNYIALSKLMSKMWASFIHDGDPNNHGVEGAPVWPKYANGPGGDSVDGMGGYGQVIVLQANGTGSYIEDDTFRSAGIASLNRMWGSVFGK